MLADIGYISLLFAFLAAIYSVFAAWYGSRTAKPAWVESARNATIGIFFLVLFSCAVLIISLLQNDFSIEYVWRVSSIEMPTYLKVTALWGGQAGSLLFWNLLLAAFTAAAMARRWDKQRELMPYVIIVGSYDPNFLFGYFLVC